MPNDIDKSLLDRLQALRGATPERTTPAKINVDLIERKKTPTREDALATRLKSLRSRDQGSPSPKTSSPKLPKSPAAGLPSASPLASKSSSKALPLPADDEEVDALFQTDDRTLEELLGDVSPEDAFTTEPDDAEVKAFLEELSRSVPQNDVSEKKGPGDEKAKDSDDSDGEEMSREVDDVIAKFKDELELEAPQSKDEPIPSIEEDEEQEGDQATDKASPDSDLAIPTLPSDLDDMPSSKPTRASADIDDITARLAALRAPSKSADDDDDLSLPSVPTSKPSGKPINRLTSRTNYTDDDVDSWCVVCLEDATLRCLGCDDDVYCTRCWREMHIGPAAGFDERSHKAVQFTKERKKNEKVAIGAS